MGKGDSRHKNRKARKRFEELAGVGLAPLEPRAKQGKARMNEIAQERAEDAQRPTLEARVRLYCLKNTDEARDVSYEADATRALLLGGRGQEERARLRQTWVALEGAWRTYELVCLGRTRHAKTAKIEMEPNKLDASAEDPPPDLRDDEERHRDARNALNRWDALIVRLPYFLAKSVADAGLGRTILIRDNQLTTAGATFVQAVRALAGERERTAR